MLVNLPDNPSANVEAFEKIVRVMHDVGVGYGAINHPVDRDPVCGYTGVSPSFYLPKLVRLAFLTLSILTPSFSCLPHPGHTCMDSRVSSSLSFLS